MNAPEGFYFRFNVGIMSKVGYKDVVVVILIVNPSYFNRLFCGLKGAMYLSKMTPQHQNILSYHKTEVVIL